MKRWIKGHRLQVLGLLVALPSTVYLGVWLAAHEYLQRTTWHGVPPHPVTRYFHQHPVTDMQFAILCACVVLGMTVLLLSHRRVWQVIGVALPILGMFTISHVFNTLTQALGDRFVYRIHDVAASFTFIAISLCATIFDQLIRGYASAYWQKKPNLTRQA